MIRLTTTGLAALTAFITDNGNEKVVNHFRAGKSTETWLDEIDDDGHLEMHGRYSADCQPHTYHFKGDEIEVQS